MKHNYLGKLMTILTVVALGFLPGGCGEQKAEGPQQGGFGPVEVAVATIQPQEVVMTTELGGRTSASLVAEVRPQVGGIIQKRLFTEGSDVKAGQALFQIDPSAYQAALDNAKAALARSEAQMATAKLKADRVSELVSSRVVSQQDYDDAEAALKQARADVQYAKASLKTARINLKYTKITAPIAGRIGKSSITEGALVTAYQPTPLATIRKLDPMNVDVTQSTAQLLRLRRRMEKGQLSRNGEAQKKVKLILEDNSIYSELGTLKFLDVAVDPTTGSVVLRIVFPNPDGILLPGMFVRAVVQEGINKNAILVPQQAISRDPKGNPLALVVDDKDVVQQRPLTLDRAIKDAWLVSSGLKSGDRVIVEGILKARPGTPVKTVPFQEEKKEEAKKVQQAKSDNGGE